jgi:pimeloyl-ACP methyl ester carboxylesterase
MLSGCVEFVVAMALAATRAGQPAITQDEIRGRLSKFILVGPGIGGWLGTATSNIVFDRLARIELDPLSLAQFSQLLILGHQAPPSEDFLRYYWLSAPADHPYPIGSLTAFQPNFADDTINRSITWRGASSASTQMVGKCPRRLFGLARSQRQ